jgi:multidrug efflux pump subunit AcrA (membrane-fusion protein)
MDSSGRDLGLRRLSRITRWLLGGAVALTGLFSVLVAHARPGQANPTSTVTTAPSTSDGVLQPPAQAPFGRHGGGVVRSGGS